MKRKAECEEERDEVSALSSMLPAKASPAAESPKVMEEKTSLAGEFQTSAVLLGCRGIRVLKKPEGKSDVVDSGSELGR